jgi:hypothetical protein
LYQACGTSFGVACPSTEKGKYIVYIIGGHDAVATDSTPGAAFACAASCSK